MHLDTLLLHFNISHRPDQAEKIRKQIIHHVFVTFLDRLAFEHPKLFNKVDKNDILNFVILRKEHADRLVQETLNDIDKLFTVRFSDAKYFHNHDEKRTPLIHYRSQKGKLVMVAFNEAIPIVKTWLMEAELSSWVSMKRIIERKEERSHFELTPDQWHYYRLMDWVALNPDNYRAYKWDSHVFRDRITILERALTGQIRRLCIRFAPKLDHHQIDAQMVEVGRIRHCSIYDHTDMVFNVKFRMQAKIPGTLAIGKYISVGFGNISKLRWQGEAGSSHTASKKAKDELIIKT